MEKGYFKGILGALLGGIVASIPWILVYVYANMIYSILAVIIAMGALKGYQLFHGKVDRKLPIILVIVSLLSITLSTLVIIPCLLIVKNSGTISIANLNLLYSNEEFIRALIGDYVISVLFTILGISGVISSVRRQIIDSEDSGNVDFDFNTGNNKKDKEKVKEYFLIRNATSENSAVKVEESANINFNTLNLLVSQRIVLQKDDKYYYSLEEAEKLRKQTKKTLIITITTTVVVIAAIIGAFIFFNDDKLTEEIDFYYSVKSDYKEYIDEENEDSWIYVPKTDLSGDSGYFTVYYLEGSYEYSTEWVEDIKTSFRSFDELKEIKSDDYFKNKNGLEVVSFELLFDEYTDTIYYVIGKSKLGVVEIIDYEGDETLQEDGREVVDTFKWNK